MWEEDNNNNIKVGKFTVNPWNPSWYREIKSCRCDQQRSSLNYCLDLHLYNSIIISLFNRHDAQIMIFQKPIKKFFVVQELLVTKYKNNCEQLLIGW